MDYSRREKNQMKREKAKEEALASQDALSYFNLVNRIGVSPEDFKLYERGQAEAQLLEQKESELEQMVEADNSKNGSKSKLETYRLFLKEAANFNSGDYRKNVAGKAELLQKYFVKFRENGSQPTSRYNDNPVSLGALFNTMVKQAKEYVRKSSIHS